MIHINPELDIGKVLLDFPSKFNEANAKLYAGYPNIKTYWRPRMTVEEFDKANQQEWHMPASYQHFDIVSWLADQFLKYMIDTFRKNDIVWGVGRGSSVASYVLFLIGVHKTDSMLYELDVTEFLRPATA